MSDDYQFDDMEVDASPAPSSGHSHGGNGNGGQRTYASEVFSKQIRGKFRTFFVDLKESGNGKFVKISEKSHGRKSTIMFDAEDLESFIQALNEAKGYL